MPAIRQTPNRYLYFTENIFDQFSGYGSRLRHRRGMLRDEVARMLVGDVVTGKAIRAITSRGPSVSRNSGSGRAPKQKAWSVYSGRRGAHGTVI
jgi:hypothetical protein